MLLRNLHLVRLSAQRLLLLPGAFQLLHPVHFVHSILQSQVCVRVHRYTDVAMSHQVLQRFRVHARSRLNTAVRMAAYMGRDVLHLFPEDLVVPFHHVIEPMLPMHRHQRHPVIVHEKESAVTVHHLFDLRSIPFCKDRPKTIADIICLWLLIISLQDAHKLFTGNCFFV